MLTGAEQLAKHGIHAMVVNARFVKPLDKELFRRISKICRRIITTEENVLMGGFGSAVLEFYQSEGLLEGLKIRCLGIPNQFYEQATQAKLQHYAGIDSEAIGAAATKLVSEDPDWRSTAATAKSAGA